VAPVSEPVKQRAGESLGAKDFGPFLKGQVRGQHEAMMLIGLADEIFPLIWDSGPKKWRFWQNQGNLDHWLDLCHK
jgi:hypothetical protein